MPDLEKITCAVCDGTTSEETCFSMEYEPKTKTTVYICSKECYKTTLPPLEEWELKILRGENPYCPFLDTCISKPIEKINCIPNYKKCIVYKFENIR